MSGEEVSSGEEVGKPFTVHVYEGADLTDEVVERLKLRELLALDLNNDQQKIDNVVTSYRRPNNALYVVQSPSAESAIGVIQVDRWARGNEWGDAYWSEVDNIDTQMGEVASKAIVLSGARTLPDWQRKGVQKSLLREIIAKENPDVILGESRNPAAVMSRSITTSESGYQTFFDMVDVSPGAPEVASDKAGSISIACSVPFVLLAENMFGPVMEEDEGLLVAHPSSSPQEAPSVDGFPNSVKNAFGNVVAVQQKVNRGENNPPISVIAPLVSIRKDILSAK